MFCGCSKTKKPPKGLQRHADESDYGLLEDIPECNGVEASDSWFPVVKCDHQAYPTVTQERHPRIYQKKCYQPQQNQGFDSGIDTGSSPDSGNSLSRSGQTVKILDPYGSTPLLEVCERGSVSTLNGNGKPSKMFQTYRGQIKLAVYLNSGLLTLHVRHAKHLTSKWSAVPCPHVKVSIIPDDPTCKTRCKTKTQMDTDRPQFDEKFSFEVGDADFNKRIFVGVYSRDPNHTRSEVLGCMSFGIHNIVRGKTSVHGWYFLLSEHIGRRKHLQAHNKRHLVVDTDDYPCFMSETTSCSEFSTVHQDIAPHSCVLRMSRQDDGYGFTLSGGCPSTVFTIEPGSPADEAGMRVGDSVLSINSQDVSRSTADTVARIVRFYPRIDIEVQSPPAPTPSAWRGSTPIKKSPNNQTPSPVRLTPLTHLYDEIIGRTAPRGARSARYS